MTELVLTIKLGETAPEPEAYIADRLADPLYDLAAEGFINDENDAGWKYELRPALTDEQEAGLALVIEDVLDSMKLALAGAGMAPIVQDALVAEVRDYVERRYF